MLTILTRPLQLITFGGRIIKSFGSWFCELSKETWWSGSLWCPSPPDQLQVLLRSLLQAAYTSMKPKMPSMKPKNRWCDTIPAVDIYIYIILYYIIYIYIWIYEYMILYIYKYIYIYIYIYVCYILLVGQKFVLHFNASFDMYWLDLICPNVMGFKLQQSPSSHGLRRSPRTRCSILPLSPRSPTYRNLANLGEQAPRWQPPIHISDMQQRTTRKQQENN